MQRGPRASGRPIGRLPSGEPYYAPIGGMRYDGDRVQCHLCGRWLKMVGGSHLVSVHGIAIGEYREMFRLFANVTTVAPETGERKRISLLDQFARGERDPSVRRSPSQPGAADGRPVALARGALA